MNCYCYPLNSTPTMRPGLVITFLVFFTANFVTSRGGKLLIELQGYTYCKAPCKGPKVRWRCSTHNSVGCRAILYTIEDLVVLTKHEHNHMPPKWGKT